MMIAYVDPGLGSLIWQTAVSAFVGLVFYFTKTRRAIVGFFRKIFGREEKAINITTTVTTEAPAKVETEVEVR